MTRREIIIQILSEVSGKPKSFVREVVDIVPVSDAMDSELPKGEAEAVLNQLRQEKAGILNWLIEGRQKAIRDIRDIASQN